MNVAGTHPFSSDLPRPTVLLILDGFGCGDKTEDNAIAMAHTPVWDRLWRDCPHTLLDCSGMTVGLPSGQMGNSEVGHLHLGAGRLLMQDFTRINQAVADGSFAANEVLCRAIDSATKNGKALHILGLLSPGGVHSHEKQIHALVELAVKRGLEKVYVHAFLDGRDTPPRSAETSIEAMESVMARVGAGRIASLVGRFYAMDRDSRWDRIEQAYNLIVCGEGAFRAPSARAGLHMAYDRGESDEFVQATAIAGEGNEPVVLGEGDVCVFMNYRADRARQLTRAMTEEEFDGFRRKSRVNLGAFVTLTEYHQAALPVAFPPYKVKNCLGEVLSNLGLKQLRLAETEKYAHVTFFFNGGREEPFEGETRILVPSPKVRTYDMKPEMSAPEVTDRLVEAVEGGLYDVIICNYANCDMVGHTGQLSAAIKAVEAVDRALGRIVEALKGVGGQLLVTADHGNVEQMKDSVSGQPHTAHTVNFVPLVCWGRSVKLQSGGNLGDVTPTLLELMEIEKPVEMTGRSLLA